MRLRTPLFLIPALLLGSACDRDAMLEQQSFASSVAEVWKDCDPNKIGIHAERWSLRMAFNNCGSNNFTTISWSPDGKLLYFQLIAVGYILNGETKTIAEIPLELPSGSVAWLGNDLLAIPTGPTEGEEGARLALYNLQQSSVEYLAIAQREPTDLQALGTRDSVYFTGLDAEGKRRPFKADFSQRTAAPAFSWMLESLDTFTYTPEVDTVAYGIGEEVKLVQGATGELIQEFSQATRASVHSNGRLVVLETMGEPISTYKPTGSGDESEAAARREEARRQRWLETKPDWLPEEIFPPALDFYDTETNRRFRFTEIHGDRYQWYPGEPRWGSFVMWGLDREQLNTNVALGNLSVRVLALGPGELGPGMVEVGAPPAPTESE